MVQLGKYISLIAILTICPNNKVYNWYIHKTQFLDNILILCPLRMTLGGFPNLFKLNWCWLIKPVKISNNSIKFVKYNTNIFGFIIFIDNENLKCRADKLLTIKFHNFIFGRYATHDSIFFYLICDLKSIVYLKKNRFILTKLQRKIWKCFQKSPSIFNRSGSTGRSLRFLRQPNTYKITSYTGWIDLFNFLME